MAGVQDVDLQLVLREGVADGPRALGALLGDGLVRLDDVLAVDKALVENRDHWLVREIILYMSRVLRRLDLTAKSFFALVEPGSCFAGNLLELLLASDRSYMLNDPERPAELAVSELNAGALPMSNGLTRLQSRFLAEPSRADDVLRSR